MVLVGIFSSESEDRRPQEEQMEPAVAVDSALGRLDRRRIQDDVTGETKVSTSTLGVVKVV